MSDPDIIDGGEATDESPPPVEAEGDSPPPQEELHADSEPHDEQRETPEHIDPQTLVRQAENVLATMDKIVRDLADEELEELRTLIGKNEQGQEWIADLEESRQFCEDHRGYIEHLKQQAERFVQWNAGSLTPRAVVETNALTRRAMLDRAELTEEEKEEQRRTIDAQHTNVNAYLDVPARRTIVDARWQELAPGDLTKTSIVQYVEEQTHLHGRWGEENTWEPGPLEEMQTTLASYEEMLAEFNKSFRRRREALEAGKEEKTQAKEGGGGWGSYNFKLIHLVHFAMAVKKIWNAYQRQWERDMEEAASKLAAQLGKPFMSSSAYQALINEVDAFIQKEANEAEKDYALKNFDELFPGGTFGTVETPGKNLAKLKVAAQRGLLYKMDEEFSTLTIYGTPLQRLVPSHWSEEQIRVYYLQLQGQNRSAAQQETQKGASEARGYLQDAFAVAQMEAAIRDGYYWKASGIAEWIMLNRVGTGKGGTSIMETIRRLMLDDSLLFGKLVPAELIKNIGGIAEKGIPEVALYSLKKYKDELVDLKTLPSERRKIRAIMDMGEVLPTAAELRERLTAGAGVAAKEVYTRHEQEMFKRTNTWPSKEQIIDQAVAKVLAGHPLKTLDGQWISVYDETNTSFRRYREEIGRSPFQIDIYARLSEFDMGHFSHMNEGKMLPASSIKVLFSYDGNRDELIANRNGGERLTEYLEGIANFYNEWEKKVDDEGAPRASLDTYVREITERLRPGVQYLKGRGGHHHLELLVRNMPTHTEGVPEWLEDVLLHTPPPQRQQRRYGYDTFDDLL